MPMFFRCCLIALAAFVQFGAAMFAGSGMNVESAAYATLGSLTMAVLYWSRMREGDPGRGGRRLENG